MTTAPLALWPFKIFWGGVWVWGVGCGVQSERKSHQCLSFKHALQMPTDLATPRLHTTEVFA